jgi:polyhydroxyalkanoate synthase
MADLFEGRFRTDGKAIARSDIRALLFAVGTEADHVAPWKSVYRIHLVSGTDITFRLTSSGYVDPEDWYLSTPETGGSWWPAWANWREQQSAGSGARHLRAGALNFGASARGFRFA